MRSSRFSSGASTNDYLGFINDVRTQKYIPRTLTSGEIEALLALIALNEEKIKKCESDLETSKAEEQRITKLNFDITDGIENGTLVIKNGKLVPTKKFKTVGGKKQKNKSKKPKSNKTKKRKYKRSKHRHTKKQN